MPATAFELPHLDLLRPSDQDLGPTMAAPFPGQACRGSSEASAFASLWIAPRTAAFAKRGSIFWTPFWARALEIYQCGVDSGATRRTPFFFLGRFFFTSLASHGAALRSDRCLGSSLLPDRSWSREPTCRDWARGLARPALSLCKAPKARGLAAEVQRQSPQPSSP